MHDLRSDTVTRPDAAMRAAMAAAEVGDDVLGEDPTVRLLEERAARRLGKEAALFVASGTMGNQVCLGVHTRPGDEILAEERSHVLVNEVGGASRLWGCQIRPVRGARGALDLAAAEALVRPAGDVHYPRTRLVTLENTHNYAGGAVLPPEHVDDVAAFCRRHGLLLHVDGARLFNAEVASGVPAARLVAPADSVSICLSKGLGAPVGSVVAGSAAFVEEARRVRKLLGGGMRQAGVLAAAGLLALEEGPARLAADHRRARALAETLAAAPGVTLDLATVQTNIVVAEVPDAPAACRALAGHGVLCFDLDRRRLRFVFHRDAGDDALDAARAAVEAVFGHPVTEARRVSGPA